MRKFFLTATLFFVFLLGGCGWKQTYSVTVTSGKETLLQDNYNFSTADALRFKIVGADMKKYCDKYFSGSATECLRKSFPKLYEDLSVVCDDFSFPCEEPYYEYVKDGVFLYRSGKPGRAASVAGVAARLIEGDGKAEIVFRVVEPILQEEDVAFQKEKLSEFSTEYEKSPASRKHNIKLAVQSLDNRMIPPHTLFSFNEAVGKRNAENGYLPSVVILNGEFTEGIGGGVCQVSTTLYNCWCLSGLNVAQSRCHSLPVGYVGKGFDAMVSETSDLVLENSSDFPLYLDAFCDDKKMVFSLYGLAKTRIVRLSNEKKGETVCDEYETVVGAENKILRVPQNGEIYQTFRDYYDEKGTLIGREKIRLSSYKPVKGKRIVNAYKEKPVGEKR